MWNLLTFTVHFYMYSNKIVIDVPRVYRPHTQAAM